jgi:ppGpp synthetase/RelA/SpoT-type nucleotidyltranferase
MKAKFGLRLMNFDEYEKEYQTRYAEFARIVRDILEKAINGAEGVSRPQSIQCRAKEASHLKPKLRARGLLKSSSIEDEIKDLAGVRLIFYTNSDVDRFLNSRLIPENFEVRWDETRIHHPTEENANQRYQAIHYTVSSIRRAQRLPNTRNSRACGARYKSRPS